MDKPMHAPLPWKVEVVWSTSPRASVIVDANGKAVDLRDHANQMLIALAVNEHFKRAARNAEETERAEPDAERNLTPMMRQYLAIKRELDENTVLMFRLGDFYEMFMDDARRAAPLLGLCLTHRAGQPMCGIPVHAIDTYLAKCVRAGITVALADQMEPIGRRLPARREITRIVTPNGKEAR